jgi:hypothetical protein
VQRESAVLTVTFEIGSAIAQIILSGGAIAIGVYATWVASSNAKKEREFAHQQWIDERTVEAYAEFHRVFMEMQFYKSQRPRSRDTKPRNEKLKEWQSATSALELFGSVPVRRQVDVVWSLAESIRSATREQAKWNEMQREIEKLRELMKAELRITSLSRETSDTQQI